MEGNKAEAHVHKCETGTNARNGRYVAERSLSSRSYRKKQVDDQKYATVLGTLNVRCDSGPISCGRVMSHQRGSYTDSTRPISHAVFGSCSVSQSRFTLVGSLNVGGHGVLKRPTLRLYFQDLGRAGPTGLFTPIGRQYP